MMKKWRIVGLIYLFVLALGLGIAIGFWIDRHNTQSILVPKDSVAEFQLISQAWNLTRDKYVDKTATEPQVLAYGTIAGMISSLGDTGHSTFLTPAELKEANNFEQGQFQGVGLEIRAKDGNVVVIAPFEGSPAQKAGIRHGDIILKVDGLPVTDPVEASQRIIGTLGTPVTLTIKDTSGTIKDITLIRANIKVEIVTWRQLPGTTIAHLRLESFSNGAAARLDTALSAIGKQGSTGIILDLRSNPGGLADEAVAVTSRFVKSGNAFLVKDSNGNITPVPVTSGVTATDLPLVVLIDAGTASAAEIVSGAIHDAGRARLVGETTFGTGTVLGQFSLSDGSALLLATQEWLTPSGKTIWHTGLAPDIVVSLSDNATPLVPSTEQDLTAEQMKSSSDAQVLEALKLLM
jgi:carboxyl-terminal processing protease